jgi:hypothetical protein
MVDEITFSLNRNVKPDFQIEKTRWNSYDGNWYQLEGVSNRGRELYPVTEPFSYDKPIRREIKTSTFGDS